MNSALVPEADPRTYITSQNATFSNGDFIIDADQTNKGRVLVRYTLLKGKVTDVPSSQKIKKGDTFKRMGKATDGDGNTMYYGYLKTCDTIAYVRPEWLKAPLWMEQPSFARFNMCAVWTTPSWLVLGCPAKTAFADAKISVKPRPLTVMKKPLAEQKDSDDEDSDDDESDLQGLAMDYAHVLREIPMICNFVSCRSMRTKSVFDANLKCEDAVQQIAAWLDEKQPTNFVLYFSGHGSVEGIAFADGILPFKKLAEVIHGAKFNTSANGDEKSDGDDSAANDRNPLVSVMVDSCYSGGIVDAFAPYKGKGVNFELFYSSQKKEMSFESRKPPMGTFTKWLFGAEHRGQWRGHFEEGGSKTLQKGVQLMKGQESGYFDGRMK